MSEVEIYICRFCLCKCENPISLLLEEDFMHKVFDVFYKLNLEISRENGLPVVACDSCYNKISHFYEYFDNVAVNQEKLASELEELMHEGDEWQILDEFDCGEAMIADVGNYIEVAANENKEAVVPNKKVYAKRRNRKRCIVSDLMIQRYKRGEPIDPGLKAKLAKNYKKLYICDHCDNYHTLSKQSITTHLFECKDKQGMPFKEYPSFKTVPNKEMLTIPCPLCPNGLKLKNEEILQLHLQEHADVAKLDKDRIERGYAPLIPCPKCERRLRSNQDLQSHLEKHDNDDLMTCELCGRTTVKSNLRNHLKNHFKTYVCEFCSKVFKNQTNLSKHIAAKHTGQECFICDRCNTRIRKAGKFKEHLSICRGPGTVWPCIHCGETFESYSHRHYHVKKFHIGYKCKMCAVEVKSVTQLKHHYKSEAHKQRSQEKRAELAQNKIMKASNQAPRNASIVLKRR